MLKPLVVGLLAGVLLLTGCGKEESGSGSGGSTSSGAEPKDVFDSAKAALRNKDGKAMWNLMSKKTKESLAVKMKPMMESVQGRPDELDEMSKDVGVPADRLKTMTAAEFVEVVMVHKFTKMAEDKTEQEEMEKSEWISAEVKGDLAYCKTKKHDGSDEWMVLTKEDGAWKMDMDATEAYKKELRGKKSEGSGK